MGEKFLSGSSATLQQSHSMPKENRGNSFKEKSHRRPCACKTSMLKAKLNRSRERPALQHNGRTKERSKNQLPLFLKREYASRQHLRLVCANINSASSAKRLTNQFAFKEMRSRKTALAKVEKFFQSSENIFSSKNQRNIYHKILQSHTQLKVNDWCTRTIFLRSGAHATLRTEG